MKTRGWWLPVLVVATTMSVQGAVGTWKNFTSMDSVRALARIGDKFWAATGGGLYGWTEGTNNYQAFTSAEGLQSVDLTSVAVDAEGNVWAGASTGVIHVYSPATGTWRYIHDIATSNQTDKRINSLTIQGDTVLICTRFGLSLFHRRRFEFGDTYTKFGSIPPSVKISCASAVIAQDSIWVAISNGQAIHGVAVAGLASGNLLPPEAWSVRTLSSPGIVPLAVTFWNNRIYTGTTFGLFMFDSGTWTEVPGLSAQQVVAVSPSSSTLLACTPNRAFTIDPLNNAQTFGDPFPGSVLAASVTAGGSGQPVVGSSRGIQTFSSTWVGHFPNGPGSSKFLSVTVDPDGNVWGASGSSNGSGFYRYDGKTWTNFSTGTNPAMPTNNVHRVSVGCDGSVWASTFGGGIIEMRRGVDTVEASQVWGANVGMEGTQGSNPPFIVPSTVACDSRGNVWFTQINAARALVVRQANGTWTTASVTVNGIQVFYLWDTPVDRCFAVDAFDNLWATVRGNPSGVISFGNRGRLDSTAAYHLNSADGLPSSVVKTIVVDRDNNVWVGTDGGIGIILDPNNPKRPGGLASYRPLLGLVINAIAVDPLNQKWVGTPEGVVVLSQDGTQLVASYTVENTGGKLIDNDVKSIAIDQNSGTVYIGTLNGLASLTTNAAAPKAAFETLSISPNPFLLPTGSPLTIDGLVENSSIKILSIEGKLIRELRTPGGRIGFWDGLDQDGEYVASGIYLVTAYAEDGRVATGKVAVIRR